MTKLGCGPNLPISTGWIDCTRTGDETEMENKTVKGAHAMERERKITDRQKTLFRMLLESYLEKWDDPTCRPRIGM